MKHINSTGWLNALCVADDVKKGFNVHFSDTFEDVYKVALDYDVNSL